MRVLKQSTAANLAVFMTDSSDHVTGKTGLTLTITASKDGAAFVSISPTVTELSNGWYKVALTTSHTDTLGDLALHISATGADPTDLVAQVRANVLGDTLPANVTQFGGTNGTFASGRPEVNTTHWGGTAVASAVILSATNIASGALTAAKFAAGAFDAVWSVTTRLLTAGTNIVLAKGTGVTGFNDLDAAGVRSAVGLASADLDTQLGTIDSNVDSVLADTGTDGVVVAAGSKTGYSLSSAGIQAIWDALTSALTTVGSVGKLLVDNINATISSRLASASYTAPLDAAGVRTAVGLASANLDTQLSTIDTNVDSVLADTGTDGVIVATNNDKTGYALSASGVDAIWDEAQSGHATAGTFGLYLDAAVSGVSTGGVSAADIADAVLDEALSGHTTAGTLGKAVSDTLAAVDTEVAAIKAKTDNLPSDPADASDVAAAFSTVNSTLSTIAGYIDTEVAAIKAKTDNLPASPAASGDIPSAASIADAVWDEATTGHVTAGTFGEQLKTDVDAILTDTAEIGAAGAGLTAVPWNAAWDAEVQSEATDALNAYDPPTKAELDSAVAPLALEASLSVVDGNVDAILVDTGTTLQAELDGIQADTEDIQSRLPATLVSGRMDASVGAMASGTITADALAADAVDEIMDEPIGDSTITVRQALKVMVAALAGKLSGAATTTVTIRNVADDTNVVTATVDADGNRSSVTLDV